MPKYKKMKVVDLFSGLGGFSQAFLDRGHDVTRYDFDSKFHDVENTIIKNVLEIEPSEIKNPDIILASPPCTHFSIAAVSHHWPRPTKQPTEATLQQIHLVKETISLITYVNPKYWILENPTGMLRKIIGKPAIQQFWGSWGFPSLKPTDLWGKLPPVDWRNRESAKYEHAERGSKKGVQRTNWKTDWRKKKFAYLNPRNSALRALIPYEFSLAVCLAVEGNSLQETLV